MITVLLCLVLLASLVQPSAPRLYAATTLSLLVVAHDWLSVALDGLAYYGTAALVDLSIVLVLARISPITKTAVRLQAICVVSILLNLVGWVSWRVYCTPELYNSAYTLVYVWVIFTLLGRDDVGGATDCRWDFSVLRYPRSGGVLDVKHGGTI